MIFTLLCIKEFVKNFPFVNKNNPSSTEGHTKDTTEALKEAPTEGLKEGPIEGLEKNTQTTKFIFMSATLDMPLFLKYFN